MINKILNKSSKMFERFLNSKFMDVIGQLTVIFTILVFSPALMVIGGILLMVRYYKYVSALVHNKTPKKYYY